MDKIELQVYGYRDEVTDSVPHCLCCGNEIRYGRKDKKFCDEHCKNVFHNRGKSHYADAKSKFDRTIERNYKILNDLLKMNISQVPIDDIVAMGFKPEFVTSYFKMPNACMLSCYDISFKLSQKRVFNIRRISLTLRQIKNGK